MFVHVLNSTFNFLSCTRKTVSIFLRHHYEKLEANLTDPMRNVTTANLRSTFFTNLIMLENGHTGIHISHAKCVPITN